MAGLLDIFSSIADNANDFYVDPEQTARQPSVMDKLRGRNGRPVTRKPAFPYPTINPEADMQAQARDGRVWAKEGFMGAERRRREREDFMARQAAARRKRPQVSASDAMLTNEGIDTGEAARSFGDFVNHLTPVEKSPTAPAVDTSMLDYAGAQGIPEYTPEYVAQAAADVEAGRYSPERIGRDALWTGMAIPMTAMQMGLNTANLAAGGTLDPLINRFNEGTDIIKQEVASPYLLESERAVQERIANKDLAGALGTMADNWGWVLSEAARNMGSMAVPSAIGGATVKAAQALPWLGRLLPTAEKAATFGSTLGNILMNAGSTMSDKEMQGLPLWKRYLAAGISGAGTGLIGAATEGGAEGQLARSIFGNEAAQGFNPFGVARSAFTEALQEGVEGGSDYAGQKWARGEPMSLKEAVAQNLPDMVMGGLTGAATHVGTNLANRIEQQEQADRMGKQILDTLDASKQQYENLAREYAGHQAQAQDFARKAGQAVAEAERRADAATQRAENAEQVVRNVINAAGQAQQRQMEGARNVANQQENMQQEAQEQPKQPVQAPETAQQQQSGGQERPAGAVQQTGDTAAGQQGTEAVNHSGDNSTSYSFAGKKGADNLDRSLGTTIRDENYALANHMEKGGIDARAIKLATGWERGADGDWRYEVHDTPFVDSAIKSAFAENELDDAVNAYKTANMADKVKLNLKIERLLRQGLTERTTTVREMLGNDAEVVRAYPDIGDAKVVFKDAGIDEALANYDKETNTITVNSKGDFRSHWQNEYKKTGIEDYDSKEQNKHIRGIIVHEIQHAIQEREGFARGGDPAIDGDGDYRRLAGEHEAESSRIRMDYTRDERRRSLSENTEKIPRSEQIVARQGERIQHMDDGGVHQRSSTGAGETQSRLGADQEHASRLLDETVSQEENPAFQRALTTQEVRTGKQGVPVTYVRRVLNKTGLNDHLNVVQHFTDLPAGIQQRLQSDMDERGGDRSGIEGFYDRQDGKVYVIADNLSPERVAAVARHETIGHYAIELMAGKELMGKAIQRVNDALEKGSPLLAKLAKEVDRRQPGLSDEARAKEVIALMAEQNIHHPVTRRILDAIRRFLHKAGLIRSDVTDAEISKMLRDAEAWLKQNGNRTWHSNQQDGGTSFSMSETQQAKASELETQYDKAIKDNDMAAAERIVQEYAELKGYKGDEYRGAHEAPGAAIQKNDFTNLEALQKLSDETEPLNVYAFANGVSFMPDDFFSPRGVRMYGYDTAEGMESYRAVKSAMESIQNQMEEYGEVRDMPAVTVYRAVPKSVSEGKMRSAGEWVSPSRKYAKEHGEYRFGEGEYRIIRETVSAENLWWDGNDINEWGFDDGENYSYKNTKNSRKLLDAVTYDSNGKPVPLSKRFNENKSQVYYSMTPQHDGQSAQNLTREDTQNRDRDSKESIVQVASIAANPDYGRLGVGTDFGNGSPVVYGDDTYVAKGKEGVMVAADGRRIPFQYGVVEADRLIPSNDSNGDKVAEYDTGAPGKLRAIAGNGRTAALQLAYKQGTAQDYRSDMTADTGHGVPADAIEKMKNPVLVRVMPEDKVTPDLADLSNQTGQASLSTIEQAKNDARRIDFSKLEFDDEGITDDSLKSFIQAMPPQERSGLLDMGEPTQAAENRMFAALFMEAWGSEALARAKVVGRNEQARTILNGLARVAHKAVQLKGMGDFDIRSEIVRAAEDAVTAARNKKPLAAYANVVDFTRSEEANTILGMFADNNRSAKRIAENLERLLDGMMDAYNSGQDAMFASDVNKDEVFANWKESLNDNQQGSKEGVRQQGRPVDAEGDDGGTVQTGRPQEDTGETARTEQEEPSGTVPEEGQQQELTPPKDGEEAVKRQQEATTEANRNTWTNRPITDWDNFIRSGFNDAVDIQRTQEDIEKAGGKITEESDTVLNEELYSSRVADQLDRLKEEGGPVHKIIELSNEAGLTVDEVGDWLYARHVILDDVNAKLDAINPGHENAGQLSGMTNEEAKAILDKHKDIPQLERIGRMIDSLMRQNVARLINGGLLTKEEGKAWMDKYQHYVPLKRDPLGVRSESAWERAKKWIEAKGNPANVEAENSHPTSGIPKGKGYEAKGKESQRRMGSKRRATNILANCFSNIEGAIVRVEKANVARSILQLARDNPNPQFWTVNEKQLVKRVNKETGLVEMTYRDPDTRAADNFLVVKEGGKEYWIEFKKDNPRAMAVLQKMKAADVASLPWVVHAIGDMTRWMGGWVTQHNPVFAVFNFVRDAQHMLYNLQDTPLAGKQLEVLKAYPSAFKGVWDVVRNQDLSGEFAQWYDEFKREGGETGFVNLFTNINDRMADLRRMQKQMQQGKMDPRRWGRALMTFIDDYNGIVENATRLAVYVTARKNGVSPKRSASIAKNITVNFNRRGRDTNWANALYMFTNANLQGHARLFTALKKSKSARIIAAAMMGIGAMMDFVNRLVLGKDDDTGNDVWDEISDFEKDTNWIIPIPGGSKDKPYAKIPMPQGLSLLPNIGRILFQTAWLKLNGRPTNVMESASRMALLTADAFNPFGSAADWMQLITPSFFRPLAQVTQNKSFTGNRLHREDVPNDGYTPPAYLRGWRNTPEHWKMMSKWLNDITGGDSITPGKINVSPETLRLLATSYIIPGNSLNIDRAFNSVGKAMRGEDVKLRDMPVFSRVAGFAPDERIAESKYHERMRELKEQHDRIKHYLKDIEKDVADWKHNRISDAQMKEKLKPTTEAIRRMGDGDVERGKLLFKRYEKFNETMGKLNKEMKEAQRKNDSVKLDRLKDVRTKLIKHLQLQDNDPSEAKSREQKWGLDLGA